jgi:hypothetical protein
MKITFVAVFVGTLILSGCGTAPQNPLPNQVACTMEAKLCADGSYVGRQGPKCEFAPCPSEALCEGGPCPPESAQINKVYTFEDIAIAPLQVVEDSRCPVDVQCIQAGTVKLKATIHKGDETTDEIFKLGEPVLFSDKQITLTAVTPPPQSKKTIAPEEYRFTFAIAVE